MALKQSVLIEKATSLYKTASLRQAIYETEQEKHRSAFLCHSHKDEVLVEGLLGLFEENQITLYIDWKDHTMPDIPNAKTARIIQKKILSRDLFLFLATANSKTSRWCPWEIGYADSSKKHIYIISTTDNYNTYGNEYLQLYPRIDEGIDKLRGSTGLAIFEPGETAGSWASVNNL